MRHFVLSALALAVTVACTRAEAQTYPQTVDATGYIAMCNDPTFNEACAAQTQVDGAQATGHGSLAIGPYSQATAIGTVAVGSVATAMGQYATALGVSAIVFQDKGVAVGNSAMVTKTGGTAVGTNARADGTNAVAIGVDSYAGDSNSVSVGSALTGYTRRIENVSNGIAATDAATVGQLTPYAAALGGGAAMVGGVFKAPSYALYAAGAAGTYQNVGAALTALDNGLAAVNTRVDNVQLTPGPPGPQGPQGPAGETTSGGGTDSQAVHYDDATSATVTLQGAQGTTVSNVRAGVADTDATNVGQVTQQVQAAIATAKSYTDASAQQTLKKANEYTDWAVGQLNDRIATAEAMSTAQTQMVASFAGADPANRNRMAAGVGFAGGAQRRECRLSARVRGWPYRLEYRRRCERPRANCGGGC